MAKIVISASSLPAGRNMSSQVEYIKRAQNYGADMYHLDIMDGLFVRQQTIDYTYLEELHRNSVLLFDVHLMISNPEKYVSKYIKEGANIISVHYEAFNDVQKLIKTLKLIKSKGIMAGLALDLDTDVECLNALYLYIDLVLIMSVKAGKGGQEFDAKALEKIKTIKKENKNILVEVDGGINDKTAPLCIKAGADILVSGSYLYNNDMYEAILSLKGKK